MNAVYRLPSADQQRLRQGCGRRGSCFHPPHAGRGRAASTTTSTTESATATRPSDEVERNNDADTNRKREEGRGRGGGEAGGVKGRPVCVTVRGGVDT